MSPLPGPLLDTLLTYFKVMNVRHVVHGNQSEDQFVRGARKICEVVVFSYSDNVVRISLPRLQVSYRPFG